MSDSVNRLLNILIPVLILLVASVTILHSIMPSLASYQLVFGLIGLLLMYALSRINPDYLNISPTVWYVCAVVPLLMTELFGAVTRGSTRWLTVLGFQLQTSELAKVVLILFSATYLTRHPIRTFSSLLTYLCFMAVPALLVFIQPDLGSSLLIVSIAVIGLIIAGITIKHTIPLIIAAALVASLGTAVLKPYQQNRLMSFISPQNDPLGAGYNAMQATIAVGSGQLIGRGLGQGTQSHLKFLPERHTDFVFASFVEELGLLGGLILIGSYIWLAYAMLAVGKSPGTTQARYIACISAGLLLTQAAVNMGMNMGLFPITGVTLPLVSYGGSSLLSTLMIIGLNVGIARRLKAAGTSITIR